MNRHPEPPAVAPALSGAVPNAGHPDTPDSPHDQELQQPAVHPVEDVAESAEPRTWGLTRYDQWFVGSCLLLGLGLLSVAGLQLSGWGRQSLELTEPLEVTESYHVEMNSADWIELALLEGIGETLAKKIVADRAANGAFRTVDDLLRVPGIGVRKLEAVRRRLRCQPTSLSTVE